MSTDESLLRAAIPRELVGVLGVQPQSSSTAAAFTEAFLKNGLRNPQHHDLQEMLTHKALILSYTRPKKKKTSRSSKRAKGGLNARQKRDMKVFTIRPEHQRYELFLPLHNLWRQYILDLCGGLKPTCNPQMVQQKLLKADFHGAIITVVRSRCPSYVGISGILVQEFKHVFKVITRDNKLKVVPKKNSVFEVEINGFVSHIYGGKIEQRAGIRSAKRYKTRTTIDL
ncbi:ribonuclease P protein subunit p29 [Pholidichthys leucotaenia]